MQSRTLVVQYIPVCTTRIGQFLEGWWHARQMVVTCWVWYKGNNATIFLMFIQGRQAAAFAQCIVNLVVQVAVTVAVSRAVLQGCKCVIFQMFMMMESCLG
jgi:hypothetical protein